MQTIENKVLEILQTGNKSKNDSNNQADINNTEYGAGGRVELPQSPVIEIQDPMTQNPQDSFVKGINILSNRSLNVEGR